MIALFWTSVSLMLLIAYSTIGLTVARIVDAWRRRVDNFRMMMLRWRLRRAARRTLKRLHQAIGDDLFLGSHK